MARAVNEAADAAGVDLAAESAERLWAMYEAAHEVAECQRVLAKTGDSPLTEVLRGCDAVYEWAHYPEGDIYDPEYRGQAYYHAHAADDRAPDEHGHFHTFVRPAGLGLDVAPAAGQDGVPDDPEALVSHLVGISVDAHGRAFRLFTTNRWVTAEVWYPAEAVIRLLDAFALDLARPSWPLNRWLTAVPRLFRPQVEALLRTRDRVVADHAAAHPERNVLEDRTLQVTSEVTIDIYAHIAALERHLYPDAAG